MSQMLYFDCVKLNSTTGLKNYYFLLVIESILSSIFLEVNTSGLEKLSIFWAKFANFEFCKWIVSNNLDWLQDKYSIKKVLHFYRNVIFAYYEKVYCKWHSQQYFSHELNFCNKKIQFFNIWNKLFIATILFSNW